MHSSRRHRLRGLAASALAVAAASALAAGCSGGHASGRPRPEASPAPDRPSDIASPSPHPADFSLFAGEWRGHGRWLKIGQDGSFEAGGRTYHNCEDGGTPCDTWSGSTIIDGRHASGRLTGGDGTNATGEVAESNDPQWLPTGSVTVTLNPANDSVFLADVVYCGPKAPQQVC